MDLQGPPELVPPEPEWEFIMVPPAQTFTSKRFQEANWLQAMEGGIDSATSPSFTAATLNSDPLFKGAKGNQYNLNDARPVFEVAEQPNGLFIGARRNAEEGHYYWRITPWVMPCFTMVPPRGDHPVHGHFWVPIDDGHCWAWSFDYHPTRALTDTELAAMRDGKGIHVKYIPGTYVPLANKTNDYLMGSRRPESRHLLFRHRGHQHPGRLAPGKHGPHRRPHPGNLTTTDNGIIMARMKLLRAARALADKQILPPGRDPEAQHVRSAAVVLPHDTPFIDGAGHTLKVTPDNITPRSNRTLPPTRQEHPPC